MTDAVAARARGWSQAFEEDDGRRPRILVAKMGQDGHDRGQKVIASAFADLGFDVDIGPLFATPDEAARQAVEERRAHRRRLLARRRPPDARAGAARRSSTRPGRADIMIVVGGVIPPQDYEALKAAGAAAIFPPGTVDRRRRRRSCCTSSTSGSAIAVSRPNERMPVTSAPLDLDTWAAAVRAGDRGCARARHHARRKSTRADHAGAGAASCCRRCCRDTGRALRIGITGVPGVGKSTFIEALGTHLTGKATGSRCSRSIRPRRAPAARSSATRRAWRGSPAIRTRSSGRRRPPARSAASRARTRETMLVCEAAGFDVVIVETVGVGQSETAVAEMVDCFSCSCCPAPATSCRASRRACIELADLIAVNKADGDNVKRADAGAADYRAALHILAPRSAQWTPQVLTVSGLTGVGIPKLLDGAGAASDIMAKAAPTRNAGAGNRCNGCGICSKRACARRCARIPRQATIAGDRGGCRRRPAFTHAGDRGNQQTAGFVIGP